MAPVTGVGDGAGLVALAETARLIATTVGGESFTREADAMPVARDAVSHDTGWTTWDLTMPEDDPDDSTNGPDTAARDTPAAITPAPATTARTTTRKACVRIRPPGDRRSFREGPCNRASPLAYTNPANAPEPIQHPNPLNGKQAA